MILGIIPSAASDDTQIDPNSPLISETRRSADEVEDLGKSHLSSWSH